MLRDCETFRRDWEPGSGDSHPEDCPSCRRWLRTLEEAIASVREPGDAGRGFSDDRLPAALGRALRELHRREGPCPEAEDLVEAALARGPSPLEGHLSACPRCRILKEILADGTVRRSPVLPPALRERLISVARPERRIPAWLRWGDLGSLAASFLLTVVLTLVAGDSAASLFREPALPAPEAAWIEEGRQRLRETWTALADDAGSGWSALHDSGARTLGRWTAWWSDATSPEILPTVEIEAAAGTPFPNDDEPAAHDAADRGDDHDE